MKKLVGIFTLALLLAVQGAQARSIMGNVLQFEKNSKAPGGISHRLTVYSNGSVYHRIVSPQLPSSPTQVVVRLTGEQMDKINDLVLGSTPVIKRFEPSMLRCFVASSHIEIYRANNLTIPLRKGAVCDGGYTVNQRPAARKLVQVLNVLESGVHARLSSAEIERQVSEILN